MEYSKQIMEPKNMPQLILVFLFILYLILDYKMPSSIAEKIDTIEGKMIVVFTALILFACSNPILGVIGIMVAYELIKRSSISTGTRALQNYYPTETKKWSPFSPQHQFPYTLEQEMVKKMAPIRATNNKSTPATYKPVLDNLYDAAPINYQGAI